MGGLHPILDLQVLNDSVMQLKFKMFTVKQFQRLLGLMAAASSVIAFGLLYMRHMQWWLRTKGFPQGSTPFHIIKQLRRCLRVLVMWKGSLSRRWPGRVWFPDIISLLDGPPLELPSQEGPSVPSGGLEISLPTRTVEIVSLASEGAQLIDSGFSTEVVETILHSRAPSTRKLYALKWRVFTS